MSRIGKKPIPIPSGVDVTIDGSHVTVKGPKGTLEHDVPEDDHDRPRGRRARSSPVPTTSASTGRCTASPARWSPTWSTGVSEGFSRELEIVGVGYRAAAAGPAPARPPARLLAPGRGRRARGRRVRGARSRPASPCAGFDKQLVGQVAADIRKIRKPEPYKGKGIRYADERVLRKAGKSAK